VTAAAKIQAEHATFGASVDARELLATLKLVLATARPSAMEVLTRVFVEQGKHGLTLASTDLLNATRIVIPRTWDQEITLPREALIDAARIAIAMRSGGVVPWLKFESRGDGTLAIRSRSGDEGELEETIEHDGPAFRLCMKASFLLDTLALGSDSRVSLRISGELDPVSIVNERANAVVMPMRV